tara:strand:+ start:90 stop:728 length:639 start_codon:yes stop_codon:yes gene_type:complete
MSWTAELLDAETLESHIENGHINQMYDDSKQHIDNGNYNYANDMDDDAKLQHWKNIFTSFANDKVNDPGKDLKLICVYKDSDPKLIHAGYYADESFHSCHSICKSIDGSNSYVFFEDCWAPQVALVKPMGAKAWVFHQTKGGSIAFRSFTARHISSLFDYENISQIEVDEIQEISAPTGDAIPTEDGSTKDDSPREKKQIRINEVLTTINFK